MESRIEKAIALHGLGYNCAQSVACTYADVMGLDETTVFRMMEAQGLGMGGMNGGQGGMGQTPHGTVTFGPGQMGG